MQIRLEQKDAKLMNKLYQIHLEQIIISFKEK